MISSKTIHGQETNLHLCRLLHCYGNLQFRKKQEDISKQNYNAPPRYYDV